MDDSMLNSILNSIPSQQEPQKYIRRQYKKLVKLYHPDKNPPHIHNDCKDILHLLQNAYTVMTNGDKLYKYNKLYRLSKKERQHNELKTIQTTGTECPHGSNDTPARGERVKKTYHELNTETNAEIHEILRKHSRYQNIESKDKATNTNPLGSLVGDEVQYRLQSDKITNFVQHIHQGDQQFNRIFDHVNKETTAIIPIQQIKSCNDTKYNKYAVVNQKDYKLLTAIHAGTLDTATLDTAALDVNDIQYAAQISAVSKFNNCDIHDKLITFSSSHSSLPNPDGPKPGGPKPGGPKLFKPKQNNKAAILQYKQATQQLHKLAINEFTQERFSSNI